MALASHRARVRQAATKALPSACSVSSSSASVRAATHREWHPFPSPSPVLASRLRSQPRGQKASSLQSSSPSLSSSLPLLSSSFSYLSSSSLSSSFSSLSFLSGRPSTEQWIRREAALLFRVLRRPQLPSHGGEVEGEKGSVCRRLRRRSLSASSHGTRFVQGSLSGATAPPLDSAVRRSPCMQTPSALLSPLSARRFASLSFSSLASPSVSSLSDSLSEESWEGRLLALRRLAEAEEGVRKGKAVVDLARGAQRGRRKSSSSALPFSVDALDSTDSRLLADSQSAGARLEAFLAALGEEHKLKSREEKLRLLVALARVRPQVLAEAPASAALLHSLVSDLLGGSGETQEDSQAEADVTAKEVLVVLGCVRRLMNLPPFASPTDRSYLRCCRLLREGRLASLSSSDLTKLLSLLARPFESANASFTKEEASGGGAASEAREEAEEDKEAEDAEAMRRQLIVMTLNVFSDRLEGVSGSPPTLDDVASLLRAAALAGTHADVLRRVFACICAAAAPEGEASSLSPQMSRQGNRLPARRQRRSQKERTRDTPPQKVTPPQAVHLLHIMTTARLYSPEAIDALLSRFDVDESAPGVLTPADSASSPLSLLPIDGAPLNGGASPVETILNAFVAKGETGKKGWGVRTLGTRSELLRLLKIVELTLRLDLPHTCSQLSPPALRVLGVIRDTPFVDPTLMTDNVLSYQLAHFLRKHRFPCERSMEGPYALRLADIERRLVVLPVDATDEDPSRVCRHAAAALRDGSGEEAGDDGLQGKQRKAGEEATKSLLDALRPETKARLTHLKELGWRVLVVHHRDWTALNSPLAKAKFVRSLLQRHGLIDLAPSGTGASR
ncbi:UNVERIFIED_CONTAM: hypothetical protein HHA_267775 [Hammondia hammondi]|eukprot:XP_008887705.1 hypothetical protein HHA_267775 [Hammondia hammondi]